MNNFEKLKVICGFKHYHSLKSNAVSMFNYVKRIQVPVRLISCVPKKKPERDPTERIHPDNVACTILSWAYTGAILSILLVNPIYNTVEGNIPVTIVSAIPVVQFMYSVIYHSTRHFDDWWDDYPELNNYGITFDHLAFASIILFVLSGATLLSRALHGTVEWYVIVSTVTGILTMSVSSVEFWFIFYKHMRVINSFIQKLNEFDTSMNNIVTDLSKIKFDLDVSIDSFKNELAFTTLIGGMTLGYGVVCMNNLNCDEDFPWESVTLFSLYQVVLFCIAKYLDNRKNEIDRVSKHPAFIKKYMARPDPAELKERYGDNIDMMIVSILEDNASTLDCQLLYHVVDSSWDQFVVLGCGIANGEYVQKGLLVVSMLVIIENYMKTA
jgi:hypothetical protein